MIRKLLARMFQRPHYFVVTYQSQHESGVAGVYKSRIDGTEDNMWFRGGSVEWSRRYSPYGIYKEFWVGEGRDGYALYGFLIPLGARRKWAFHD